MSSDALRDAADRLHHVSGVDELVACLTSAMDRALRPWKVTVLLRSESRSHFVSLFGATDPLPSSSLLAELALAASGPLDTAVSGPTSPLRWLPLAERLWLVDSGARLLVPLRASDRTLLGVIALGDRRSGRPYDDGDRQWLHDLARVAAQTIEAHSATADGQPRAWRVGLVERHTRANECARCGLVTATDHSTCPDCRSQLDASGVPLVLFGKFQFERRIGRGGQGLVYRATDLSLDRPVAVKTLPGTSPEHAERLRQEARVMAAITHRHLAVIYGMESWRGQPLLLCEFMEQGTLADRLAQAPLTTDAALTLGVELADALSVIHARQLLHRDIKPSNIGYAPACRSCSTSVWSISCRETRQWFRCSACRSTCRPKPSPACCRIRGGSLEPARHALRKHGRHASVQARDDERHGARHRRRRAAPARDRRRRVRRPCDSTGGGTSPTRC